VTGHVEIVVFAVGFLAAVVGAYARWGKTGLNIAARKKKKKKKQHLFFDRDLQRLGDTLPDEGPRSLWATTFRSLPARWPSSNVLPCYNSCNTERRGHPNAASRKSLWNSSYAKSSATPAGTSGRTLHARDRCGFGSTLYRPTPSDRAKPGPVNSLCR